MHVVTVVGARPQFIKAAPVSRALARAGHEEFLVHTGQHYDDLMSEVFFKELDMAPPSANLQVGSGGHGWQTGQMMAGIERILLERKPSCVLVYGDTNSTLAGALVAAKLHVPVVHVEAGLRSFNRRMPEEHNRVLTDHSSDILFCPTQTAVTNLAAEGIVRGVHMVGDVMVDALMAASAAAESRSTILSACGLSRGNYLLATVHRAENTDDPSRLTQILTAFDEVGETVVFPVHPRTRKVMDGLGYVPGPRVQLIEPVGYLDMMMLAKSARLILTDSGGVQKEAYCLRVPCVTLRTETEWVETVGTGWNRLAGATKEEIVAAVQSADAPAEHPDLFGDGRAAERCASIMTELG